MRTKQQLNRFFFNRVAKRVQHVEFNDIEQCWMELLNPLGRGLRYCCAVTVLSRTIFFAPMIVQDSDSQLLIVAIKCCCMSTKRLTFFSKETVVIRRWGKCNTKKETYKLSREGNLTTVKKFLCWCFNTSSLSPSLRQRESRNYGLLPKSETDEGLKRVTRVHSVWKFIFLSTISGKSSLKRGSTLLFIFVFTKNHCIWVKEKLFTNVKEFELYDLQGKRSKVFFENRHE